MPFYLRGRRGDRRGDTAIILWVSPASSAVKPLQNRSAGSALATQVAKEAVNGSGLAVCVVSSVATQVCYRVAGFFLRPCFCAVLCASGLSFLATSVCPWSPRSEEHTSELQS